MPKKRLKKMCKLKEYMESCPNGFEVFTFECQKDADNFGQKLKKIAQEEEKVDTIFDLQMFEVKITVNTVRLFLRQPELVCC